MQVFLFIIIAAISCAIDTSLGGDIFRLGKVKALMLIVPVILFFELKKRMPWQVAAFLCYGTLVWVKSGYPIYGTFGLMCMFSCAYFADFLHKFDKDMVAKVFVWIATAQAVYGILQFFNIQLLYPVPEVFFQKTPLALQGQHTVLGSYLAACMAPALWFGMWIPAALMVICIAMTGSSMAYLSTAVVLGLYAWKYLEKEIIFMGLFAAVGVAVWLILCLEQHDPLTELYNFHERPVIWRHCWNAFKYNLFLGGGPGYWSGVWQPQYLPIINGYVPDNTHGEWATLLVEYGLAGVGIVLAGFWSFIRKWRLDWPQVLCASLLANGFANFPFHLVTHGVLFLWSLSYCLENGVLKWNGKRL